MISKIDINPFVNASVQYVKEEAIGKDQMEGIELIFPREMKTALGFILSIQPIVKTIGKRCMATLDIWFYYCNVI